MATAKSYGYLVIDVICEALVSRGVDPKVIEDLKDYQIQRSICQEAYVRQHGAMGTYKKRSRA